jgi:hypothetical protein
MQRPALLTGTSSEFLGQRPLPKVVRQRGICFLIGPRGVGKTEVALRVAGENSLYLSNKGLDREVLDRVRSGVWRQEILTSEGVVLDGPVFLRSRPSLSHMLVDLFHAREGEGRRTVLVDTANGNAVQTLMGVLRPGRASVIALRFPISRRARLRYARKLCEEMGLPEEEARGSPCLEPWSYADVREWLRLREEQELTVETKPKASRQRSG